MDWLRERLWLNSVLSIGAAVSGHFFLFSAPVVLADQTLLFASDSRKPVRLSFQEVLQRVRKASLALQRGEQLRQSADASESAVSQQSAPSLQMSSSVTAQWVSPSKQQHSLTVGATLWDFGRQSAQELRAAAQKWAANAQVAESEELLRIRTARAFVAACGADSVLALVQEQLRNAESKLKTVTEGYRRGERPESDVVKLKVELGRARLLAKKSQDEAEWMRAQLLLPTLPRAELPDSFAAVPLQTLTPRSAQQWNQLIQESVSSPIEAAALERIRSAKISLESELDSLAAEAYPQLSGSAGGQGMGTFRPIKPDLFAQINLQYTLPLSSVRDERRASLLARVKENLLSLDDELKTRREKLLQAKLRMEGVLQQIELQKSQIVLLLEFQKLVRARYFAGRASLLELSNSEDDLLANRLELTRLELSLYTAAIDAEEALGGKRLEKLF